MLQDSVQRFVRDEYSFDCRKAILESAEGYSEKHWRAFADLGWLAVPFSEADGGYGGSAVDLMLIMEELGRGLALEPFVASAVLSGGLVSQLGSSEQKHHILPGLISGELQLASAISEQQSRYNVANVVTTAKLLDSTFVLNGQKTNVLNGPKADQMLVTTRIEGGGSKDNQISVFIVDPASPGVKINSYRQIDGHVAATVEFRDVIVPKDAKLSGESDTLKVLNQVLDLATMAVSSEAIGALEQLLTKTVDYAKTRKQFDVPIGSFQALQHRMADMFIECQLAQSIVLMAAMELDSSVSSPEKAAAVSAAKCRLGKSIKLVGQEAIQIHGGIGMTDELDVAHYFKRVTAIGVQFGDEEFHARRYRALQAKI